MITRINYAMLGVYVFTIVAIALFVGSEILRPAVAGATETPTYPFKLTKSISDNYTPDPYTADEFKFTVSGNGTVDLIAFTNDTAEKVIYLPEGTYTVAEVGPAGFVPADWTVQWSGYGCSGDTGNGPIRSIGIEVKAVTDPDAGGNVCKADNQWRPKNDGGGDNTPKTGRLPVSKVIVGTTTVPKSNFSFTYTGATGNTAFEVDGTNVLTVATGTYSVTEAVAAGYTTTYSNCTNVVVTAGATTTPCVITNTLITDNGGGGGTGTIVIEKQTLPDGNQTSFTFNPSWSDVDFTLSDNGRSTTTNLAVGTYNVVETLSTNWTQTSVVCSDGSPVTAISLQANETVTCVFTNTLNGGGGGDTPTWLVYGYVWHDKNQSDIWDKEQPNPADDEVDLDGWTVQITNGSATYSTTTDPTGYYYFYVPVGTWTINEVIQSGWSKTFPNVNGHIVEVTGPVTYVQKESMFAMLLNSLIPTAYAQSVVTYGPFDFGNFFTGGGDNNGGGGGGGGSHSSSKKTKSSPTPVPAVLGESTSVLPVGAPRTGAGGAAQNGVYLQTLLVVLPRRQQIQHKK